MIRIYTPACRDLRFRQAMLADEETMSYNHAWGGTIPFPEEDWEGWYEHWIAKPEGKRLYRYVTDEAGNFVGEIACHLYDELGAWMADVLIHARHRGKGYGGEALEALCSLARENGIKLLYDDIAADNPAIGMFLRHGFAEERRTEEKIYLKKAL